MEDFRDAMLSQLNHIVINGYFPSITLKSVSFLFPASVFVLTFWAPATKVRQNLSIVAKNENSTEHFVHLHADM